MNPSALAEPKLERSCTDEKKGILENEGDQVVKYQD